MKSSTFELSLYIFCPVNRVLNARLLKALFSYSSRISNVSSRLERTMSASESGDSDDDSEDMEDVNPLTSSMYVLYNP